MTTDAELEELIELYSHKDGLALVDEDYAAKAYQALIEYKELREKVRGMENIIEYLFLNLTRYMVIPKDVETRINNIFQKQGE